MIYKSRNITININKTDIEYGNIGVRFYTEDLNTAAFNLNFKEGSLPANLKELNLTPHLHIFSQDGSIFLDEVIDEISVEKGQYQYKLSESVLNHTGKTLVKIILKGAEESVHVANFYFYVNDSGLESLVSKEMNVEMLGQIVGDFLKTHPELLEGQSGSKVTVVDGYLTIDGVKTDALVDVTKYQHSHPISEVTGLQTELDKKLGQEHASDTTVHISSSDRKLWDSKLSPTVADNKYLAKADAFTQEIADTRYVQKDGDLDINLTDYVKTTDADSKYSPVEHTHDIKTLTNFDVEMNKKADVVHSHDDVYRKISDSYSKSDSDLKYAAKVHTHTIGDISNLQVTLDSKTTLATVTGEVDKVKLYVQSRGENLVTNGTGLMGDNTNFPDATFKTDEVKVGGGSFFTELTTDFVGGQNVYSAEYIPVDPEKTYQMSIWAKSKNGLGTQYAGVICVDIDKNTIDPSHYAHENSGIVKLTQPLKVGDTTVVVDDITPWTDLAFAWNANADYKGLVMWGYKNSKGYTYPDGTYSRLTQQGIANIDVETKTITLRRAWGIKNPNTTDGVFPIGSTLSRSKNGSNYNYVVKSGGTYPKVWTNYTNRIGGITNTINDLNFRPGTAFVKMLFLTNRQKADATWLSGIEFKEVDTNSYALAGHNHDLTYVKKTDGQAYKLFNDDGNIPRIDNIDFNNPEAKLTKSGFYFSGYTINHPTGEPTFSFVRLEKNANEGKLIYYPVGKDTIYIKTKSAGTWGEWTKLNGSTATADMTGYDKTATLDTKYAPISHTHSEYLTKTQGDSNYAAKTHTHTATDIGTYTKSEIDSKIATAQTGGSVDLSTYSTTAQADAKYATKSHNHTIADVTNLQSTLDGKAATSHTHTTSQITGLDTALAGKAPTSHTHTTSQITDFSTEMAKKANASHTHAIADVTGLQSALDGKLTKSTADTLYTPIGSSSGGTTTVSNASTINANKRWGFVGDGTTDNYQAFKDMLTFVNSPAGQGAEIEWDGLYNGVQAQYRVDRYVTISSIDAAYASGSPTHMIWKAKDIKLKTNGAKFINMPMNGFTKTKAFTAGDGSWHYAKEEPITLFNFEMCDGVIIDSLFVDGENHKIKYATGFTSKENDNPRWTDKKPLAEGRGHGVVFAGSKNISITNLKSINQAVDGVAIAFNADYGTMKVDQTTSFHITNLTATGNGRLGVSGLGCHGGEITNLVAEYNGTNKNADGHFIYFSPAGGVDVEPHHSPIAMDNTTPTSYKVEDWNGSMVIKNARIRYNSGTQIACTSTLLTRNVIFERGVVRPPKGRTTDHQLIQSSLQNCRFIDMDVDGKLADGALSRVMLYGAGYVSESTGVITGQAANVWSEIKGGKWANIEPWVNTDGNTTYNEIPTGQYGLHNIVFADLIMENVRFTLRTIRRFIFRNVVMNYPADSTITKLYMWNAAMKDVVMINRKSSNITLDLGTNDSQSNFENLRISTGKFDWATGTKKYKTAAINSESLDVYDYTRAMEYLLLNSGGGGSAPVTPSDTAPPNAPTVNPVYTADTTVTGTAEANSTVTATFKNGGTTLGTASATTSGTGSYSIAKPSGVTFTAGYTVSVTAKDAANNTSSATTVTIQTTQTGTGANLWPTTSFDFTNKTIPQLGGSGSKYAMNSAYTISNNEAQPLNMTGSGDTVIINATAGASKYGFFTLEPNTQYTVRVKASDTIANASDLVTMIGGDYIWPNPKVIDVTFTTDSNGKYGYDFNGVVYSNADATKGLFHRANGGQNSVTTYKIWLNKGATSTATWSS